MQSFPTQRAAHRTFSLSSHVRRIAGELVTKVAVDPLHVLVWRVKEGVGVVGTRNQPKPPARRSGGVYANALLYGNAAVRLTVDYQDGIPENCGGLLRYTAPTLMP